MLRDAALGAPRAVALQEFRSPGAKRLALAATLAVLVAASGAGLLANVRQYEAARRPPWASQLDMAKALQAATAPGDVVLSDDQYVAALADRDVPPQMVDTSSVRIASGYLTTAQLKDLITHNNIPAILFATGRFDGLSGFRAWVARRYALAATFGKDKSLFVLGADTKIPLRFFEGPRRTRDLTDLALDQSGRRASMLALGFGRGVSF